ncbi:phage minor capsid protein [Streptomyces cinereoruber]|uniref:phage minor capsid protein n=1 Tax=Streptomyces cinereoruber TaxID=67260 RepID=UPI00363F4440
MPVSPALAEDLARAVASLYEAAEVTLLERLRAALAEGIDSPAWVNLKLAALGDLQAGVAQAIAALEADASGAIHQAVAEAYDRGQQAAVAELGALGVGQVAAATEALPAAAAVDRLAAAVVEETGAAHLRILRQTLDVYREVISTASAAPLLGAQTRRQAAQSALDRFAARGITGFVDTAGRSWNLVSYTEMATRTAVGRAAIEAHTDRLGAAGVDLVIVSAAPEECDRCKPWEGKILTRDGAGGARTVEMEHATEDGRMVQVRVAGSLPEARAAGLLHPNCFPGSVLVSSSSEVLAADARRYKGEIVVIHTASGVELPVTPNHPVLTPEGWVPAGALKVGDHVLRHSGNVEASALRAPGDQQVPARISEIFNSLREASQVPSVRVPVTAEQFHGDGLGSDVEVVFTDGLLSDGGDSQRLKVSGESALFVGGVGGRSLLPESATFEICSSTGHPSDGVVGGGDKSQAFLAGHAGVSAVHGFTAGNGRVAVALQAATEGRLADADGGRRLALGLLAGEVTLDGVVELGRRDFDGHVYNLQTGDGWYVAEGLVVHNCRHDISAYLPGLTRPPAQVPARGTYKQSQQQRYFERQIRAWKRREAVALDGAARTAARARVRVYQARVRELVEATGMPRKSHREQLTQAR